MFERDQLEGASRQLRLFYSGFTFPSVLMSGIYAEMRKGANLLFPPPKVLLSGPPLYTFDFNVTSRLMGNSGKLTWLWVWLGTLFVATISKKNDSDDLASRIKKGKRRDESIDRHVFVERPVQIDLVEDFKQKYESTQTENTKHNKKQLRWTRISAGLIFVYAALTFWQVCETRESIRLSEKQFQQTQRAWVGLDDSNQALTVGPIQFDANLTPLVGYAATLKNFGNYAAQNAFTSARLLLTDTLQAGELERLQKKACDAQSDPMTGDLIFPGRSKAPSYVSPGVSDPATSMTPRPMQAFLVGCVVYRDQFNNRWHTGFIYWLLDPQTARPVHITPSPNSQFTGGVWQEKHSSLFEEESDERRKYLGEK